eukprot:scaffold29796_cov43-Cyclotella_meneghiniana.AAC.1
MSAQEVNGMNTDNTNAAAAADDVDADVELNIVPDNYNDDDDDMTQQSQSTSTTNTKRIISYKNLVPKARRPTIDGGGSRYLSTDWILSLLSIPRSYLLRRIKSHVLFDQSVCLLVYLFHTYHKKNISIPLLGHTLLGSFLGLLLAFRTNSAYDRFWEARGYWCKTSAVCRSLAMETVWHLKPYAPVAVGKLEKLIVAFPDVLAYTCLLGVRKARLPWETWDLLYDINEEDDGKSKKRYDNGFNNSNYYKKVKEEEQKGGESNKLEMIALDPGTVILHKMNQCLHEASYETKNPPTIFNFYLSTMGAEIGQLSDALSGCEKI